MASYQGVNNTTSRKSTPLSKVDGVDTGKTPRATIKVHHLSGDDMSNALTLITSEQISLSLFKPTLLATFRVIG